MANVGYATLQVIPSLKGIGPALTSGVAGPAAAAGTTAGSKLGSGMLASVRNFAGPLVAATAGIAVFGFLKSAQQDASDLNETANKSAVIFGDQAGAIDKWASAAASSAGLSKKAALDAAAGFGDMFLQLGFAGTEAAKMSTSTVQLAADLGSFNNLPTADVSQRIGAAFRGEYDSLQLLIPNINAARVQTEALAMTGKTNAKELTAQEKAAAVLAIVNHDGARAAGDFAKTSGANANAQKILTARYENAKTAIGKGLIPVMGFLLKAANVVLAGFIALGGFFAKHADTIKLVAGVITAFFIPALVRMGIAAAVSAAETVALWVMIKASAIRGAAAQAVASLRVVAAWVLMGVQSLLAAAKVAIAWLIAMGPIAIVTAAVIGLVALIIANFDTIKKWIGEAWDWVKTKTTAVWDALIAWISEVPGRILAWLTGAWDFIATEAGVMKIMVIGWFEALGQWISGLPGWLRDKAGDVWGWLVDAAKSAAAAAWQAIKDQFTGAGSGLLGGLVQSGLPGGFPSGLEQQRQAGAQDDGSGSRSSGGLHIEQHIYNPAPSPVPSDISGLARQARRMGFDRPPPTRLVVSRSTA